MMMIVEKEMTNPNAVWEKLHTDTVLLWVEGHKYRLIAVEGGFEILYVGHSVYGVGGLTVDPLSGNHVRIGSRR